MYIGSAVDFMGRWQDHKIALRKGIHHSILLQRAWNKYGEDCFEFSEIEFVDREELISKEQFYLDLLKPEYNICKIAGSCLGIIRSEETRRKIGNALKGKSNPMCNIDRDGINNPMYGRKHSNLTKAKMSVAKVGEKHPLYGKSLSEEHKAKISKANKGQIPWNKNCGIS